MTTYVVVTLAIWTAVAICVAGIVGRAITLADRRRHRPVDTVSPPPQRDRFVSDLVREHVRSHYEQAAALRRSDNIGAAAMHEHAADLLAGANPVLWADLDATPTTALCDQVGAQLLRALSTLGDDDVLQRDAIVSVRSQVHAHRIRSGSNVAQLRTGDAPRPK